jgi:hypothetical protein
MIFLPFIAAAATAATVTVGEVVGIGATLFGIGAGIKGAMDYQKAKKLKEEADAEYREMSTRIRRDAARLKKNSAALAG